MNACGEENKSGPNAVRGLLETILILCESSLNDFDFGWWSEKQLCLFLVCLSMDSTIVIG
jgi:hypothetical protein